MDVDAPTDDGQGSEDPDSNDYMWDRVVTAKRVAVKTGAKFPIPVADLTANEDKDTSDGEVDTKEAKTRQAFRCPEPFTTRWWLRRIPRPPWYAFPTYFRPRIYFKALILCNHGNRSGSAVYLL